MTSGTPPTPGSEGSDPACWAHLLCPECGAVLEDGDRGTCWRCGTALPPGPPVGPADEAAAEAEEG
jgi:hypothetical protein